MAEIRSFWNNKPNEGTNYLKFGDAAIPGQEQSVRDIIKLYTSGVVVETKKPMFFGDTLVPQNFNGDLSLVEAHQLYEQVEHDWLLAARQSEDLAEEVPRAGEPSQSSTEHDASSPVPSGDQTTNKS